MTRWRDGDTITIGPRPANIVRDDTTDAMIYRACPFPDDDLLTRGVMIRRCLAWLIDLLLLAC